MPPLQPLARARTSRLSLKARQGHASPGKPSQERATPATGTDFHRIGFGYYPIIFYYKNRADFKKDKFQRILRGLLPG
jgi:hypothetical protein